MRRARDGAVGPATERGSLRPSRPRRGPIDLLLSALIADDVATITEPHIVLVCDPYVAELSAYGPFDNALSAASVAEELRIEMVDDEHGCAIDAVVIPLRLFEPGAV